jgi:hypothetical protein
VHILRSFADVLLSPTRALSNLASRRSVLPPLLAAAVASAAFTAVLVPQVDWEQLARDEVDARAEAPPTPHEMEEKIATRRKMGAVAGYAGALFGAPAVVFLVALALWVGFRVAGSAPGFAPTLAVSAWATVPSILSQLLSIPAVARAQDLLPASVPQLLPWNASYLLPMGAKGATFAAAAALDLFNVWGAVLLALGMASVAGVSRRRSAAVVFLLWFGLVAAGMAAAAAAAASTPAA